MNKVPVLLLIAGVINCLGVFGQTLNVKDFGAVNDRSTLSTKAIQAAIDSGYVLGGAKVIIPSGDYECGTIVLKAGVALFLDEGATIHASRNLEDYRMPLEDGIRPVLIYANGAENISILGKGKISGHAEHVYEDLRKVDRYITDITENARLSGVEMKRWYKVFPAVNMVTLTKCKGVVIKDITISESPFWTLHVLRSSDILIERVSIFSSLESGVNADGIDINSCQNVEIRNCHVATGDDAIVLKSWYSMPCENVLVTDCKLSSSSSALKLGTESNGDFRNILFTDCEIENTNRGLSIFVRQEAQVDGVIFQNITMNCTRRHFNWWGDGDPIDIILTDTKTQNALGSIKNILFQNIVANGMGTSKIRSTEGMQIENIRFNNVQFNLQAEDYADKRATHALVFRNVKNITMTNVSVNWDSDAPEEKWASALMCDTVNGLVINGFQGRQGLLDGEAPVFHFLNTKNVSGNALDIGPGLGPVVKVDGEISESIYMQSIMQSGRSGALLEQGADVKHAESIQINE